MQGLGYMPSRCRRISFGLSRCGFRVSGRGVDLTVHGVGVSVQGLKSRVWTVAVGIDPGFRVQDLGCRVPGFGV